MVPLFVEQRHQGRGDDRGGNMSRFAYTVSLVALMAARDARHRADHRRAA